ncbi:putative reverse transcriptase zinc-binding domain-containing protein [Medicago truncatula]|uniref:Putative reverse transcriptase zinc-binding domain-containing protein n=1 Tax=Medicago truncatula TaxID=3880 RepID=A0A396J887_MEDTR|nr:putative reverse transcriptase zinc-binding domain-containing protein [Medicago truncatula]
MSDKEVFWAKDVWNLLIPLRLSVLVWRLFLNRLANKDNLSFRGVRLNSLLYYVGGCGRLETVNRVFFNCAILSMIWRESLK